MTSITITQAIKAMELTIHCLREDGESPEREISYEFLLNKIISCDIQAVDEGKTSDDEQVEEVKVPKKRGRPPKKAVDEGKTSDDEQVEEVKVPKKRGRPPKKVVEEEKTSDEEEVKVPKKRGRPPKKVVEEEKTSDDEEVKVPKKRGRPPKKVVKEEKTSDEESLDEEKVPKKVIVGEKTSDEEPVEDNKPVKPRALKEPIDLSSYGDLGSLDWKRFDSNEGSSSKYWRTTIQQQESEGVQVFRVLVHYGKIYSKGVYVQKTFESEDSGNNHMEHEIKSKIKKGYVNFNVK